MEPRYADKVVKLEKVVVWFILIKIAHVYLIFI